jgi:hypothetical protein
VTIATGSLKAAEQFKNENKKNIALAQLKYIAEIAEKRQTTGAGRVPGRP